MRSSFVSYAFESHSTIAQMIEFMDEWSAFFLSNMRLLGLILFSLLMLWYFSLALWEYKQRSAQLNFRPLWKGHLLLSFANALLVLGLLIKFNRPVALVIKTLILSFLGLGLFLIFRRNNNVKA